MNKKDLRFGHDPRLFAALSVIKRTIQKDLALKKLPVGSYGKQARA